MKGKRLQAPFGVILSFLNSDLHHLREGANTGPGWCTKLISHHPFSFHKATINADLAVIPLSVQRAGKYLCLPPTSVLEGPVELLCKSPVLYIRDRTPSQD